MLSRPGGGAVNATPFDPGAPRKWLNSAQKAVATAEVFNPHTARERCGAPVLPRYALSRVARDRHVERQVRSLTNLSLRGSVAPDG